MGKCKGKSKGKGKGLAPIRTDKKHRSKKQMDDYGREEDVAGAAESKGALERIDGGLRMILQEVNGMVGKILAVWLVGVGMAVGQTATAPVSAPVAAAAATTATAAAPAKVYAFDVVSIRQNQSLQYQSGPGKYGPTPDGYRMTSAWLALVIMTAYPPQTGGGALFTPDRLTGLPDWAMSERYDIDAKVAEEDLPEWQKPARQTAMLQAMLQALLVERCKIVVHRESKDSPVYLLEVGKSGPRFKATDPAVAHPPGVTLPGGAILVPGDNGAMHLYGVSMGMLATLLDSLGVGELGRPIQDKTGLAGLYNVAIPRQDMGAADGQSLDPSEKVFATVEALGLKLESRKSSVETLVIDHMERPSAN